MAFIEGIENKYPKELLQNRNINEGNLIGGFFLNPHYYSEYKLSVDELITEDGQFYFQIGKEMYGLGYKTFDIVAVSTYLNDKEIIKNGFDKRGGYATIKELMDIIDSENMDVYYDEIIKNNIIIALYDKGFNVIKDIDKLSKMKSSEVYDFYDFQLNNIFVKKQIHGLKIFDLTKGYDEYLAKCDAGQNLGIPIASGSKILNYHLCGIHKQSVLLHCSHSGKGKSSSSIVLYILPILEQGEKVVICANEQSCNDWRNMLLPSVISNKLNYWGFNRQRLQYGKFSAEEKSVLENATIWLKKYESNLLFIDLSDYNIATFKKLVAKYSRLGFTTWIYDTMKPTNESDDRAWGYFTQDSKDMLQVSRQYDIRLIATAQLSLATSSYKFLDASCLAKAKAIKEVADAVIMFRTLFDEEKDEKNTKHYVHPFHYTKSEDGKYLKEKTKYDLDPNKDYAIFFVDKNRFGNDGFQFIMEKNLAFNVWRDTCYCNVPQWQ